MSRNSRQSNGILNLVVEHQRAAGTMATTEPPVEIEGSQGRFGVIVKISGQSHRYLKQAVVVGMQHSNVKNPLFSESPLQRPHGFDQKRKERRFLFKKFNHRTIAAQNHIVLLQSAQLLY